MKSHRLARVSEVVREVAAEAILFELRDPRIKNVTVTRAEVSADLQHAKVYVSIMGSEKDQKLALHGLESSAGFVQSKLAKRLTSRSVPHVTFVLDEGVKKSLEIARILREEQGHAAQAETEAEDAAGDAAPAPDHPDQPR
jgi:ribosome-binding factor A